METALVCVHVFARFACMCIHSGLHACIRTHVHMSAQHNDFCWSSTKCAITN